MSRTTPAPAEPGARPRSGLALLVLATAGALGAYTIVGLGARDRVPVNLGVYGPLQVPRGLIVDVLAAQP